MERRADKHWRHALMGVSALLLVKQATLENPSGFIVGWALGGLVLCGLSAWQADHAKNTS